MAVRYIGSAPIKMQDGRIIKHNDIVDMPEDEAEKRYGFEVIKTVTKEKESTKEKKHGKL